MAARRNRSNYLSLYVVKGLYYCLRVVLSGFTDKRQIKVSKVAKIRNRYNQVPHLNHFQYLTALKGPQEGTYLYKTTFLSQR